MGYFFKSISAYLIKNVALNFVVCLRVGALGKKISAIKEYRNHSRKKNRSADPMVTQFHELQLQLYFGIYILRVINYCAFRSQNNSDHMKYVRFT